MLDESAKSNGVGGNEQEKAGEPKKKKLAVVFHSQNSANHKNHPLGKLSGKRPASGAEKETPAAKKTASPNGRPLPPGTARVTPLKELN